MRPVFRFHTLLLLVPTRNVRLRPASALERRSTAFLECRFNSPATRSTRRHTVQRTHAEQHEITHASNSILIGRWQLFVIVEYSSFNKLVCPLVHRNELVYIFSWWLNKEPPLSPPPNLVFSIPKAMDGLYSMDFRPFLLMIKCNWIKRVTCYSLGEGPEFLSARAGDSFYVVELDTDDSGWTAVVSSDGLKHGYLPTAYMDITPH